MNSYIFGILKNNGDKDNCHKGTQYYLKANIDTQEYYKEWSIFDEIDNTDIFKEVCEIKQRYLSAKLDTDKDIIAKIQENKENEFQRKKNKASLSDDSLQILNETVIEHTKLVDQFKQGNDKAFNSLVGKALGNLKKQNIKEDPFDVSIILKEILNK